MRRISQVEAFGLICASTGAAFYSSFFWNFQRLISDWSGFGFTWTAQLFYNFAFGRPFQSSLCAGPAIGTTVGFTANPHAYIHANVIHVNVTPYFFALLWRAHPTPAAIYALIFAWNLLMGTWLTVSIMRRLKSPDLRARTIFVCSTLIGGGMLSVLCEMGQMLLFAGPFMLAVYDAYLARNKVYFIFASLALALVTEDAAMVLGTMAFYIALFEEEGTRWGTVAGVIAAAWLILVLLIIQPAGRRELTLVGSSTVAAVAGKIWEISPSLLLTNLRSMTPLIPSLLAFPMAVAFFGMPARSSILKAAALAVAAALPHWAETLVVGGGHHVLPPFFALYLALILFTARARGTPQSGPLAWAAAAAFLLVSVRVSAGHAPADLKPFLYSIAGRKSNADRARLSLAVEERSNRSFLETASRIPQDASLAFLSNSRISGHLSLRSDVWEFPDQYSRTDFVLIQKDAIDVNYSFTPSPSLPLALVFQSTPRTGSRSLPVTPAMVAAVRADLTAGRSYRTTYEDEHSLLLERGTKEPIPSPKSTYGYGWFGTGSPN